MTDERKLTLDEDAVRRLADAACRRDDTCECTAFHHVAALLVDAWDRPQYEARKIAPRAWDVVVRGGDGLISEVAKFTGMHPDIGRAAREEAERLNSGHYDLEED